MTLLANTSMPCIIFISTFNVLPTEISLLLFFAVDRVTRHIFKVQLLVPFQPILLELFKVLSGSNRCDNIWGKLWGGSSNAF